MEKVKIVTDSTCYMPKSYIDQYDITVVPLYVRFGDEAFKEGIDMTHDEFYKKVKTSQVLPETTQPSAEDFESVYRKLLEEGNEIISIHISAGLSGTLNSANAAKESIGSEKIHIFDSKFTSMGLGYQIIEIAKMLYEEHLPLESVLNTIPTLYKHMNIYFLVKDLFWLARLGRIGKAKALLGTVVKIKPILFFDEGVVNVLEQPRTLEKGKIRMVELLKEKVEKFGLKYITVAYGNNLEEAEVYRDFVEKEIGSSVSLTQLGPVIGTHTGPDVLSIHFYTETF
ncbi:MAG: DegV family protein [Caldisericaceae bacterium]